MFECLLSIFLKCRSASRQFNKEKLERVRVGLFTEYCKYKCTSMSKLESFTVNVNAFEYLYTETWTSTSAVQQSRFSVIAPFEKKTIHF